MSRTSWSHPGEPQRTLDAGALRDWCDRLCAHPSADAREAVEGLGIPGSLTGHFSSLILDPPPPGVTRFVVDPREGDWLTVKLTLDGGTITQARLAGHFGPGRASVRVHWDSPHAIGYRVEREDAPFSCDLFAYYDRAPNDSSVPDDVLIRRQRMMRAPLKKMPG